MISGHEIDLVVLWVDGADPAWLEEKARWQFSAMGNDTSSATNRFRDWDNMRYWFRSIEKYVPWVRRIHFVTWGHTPAWLNEDHPRLHIVKHSDFIPESCLPTFSANPIELNIHRISGLSENFVFFNDDMFVLQALEEKFFFQKGLPCDRAIQNILLPDASPLFGMRANDLAIVNRHFSKKESWRKHWEKYLSPRYGGIGLYRNLVLLPWMQFSGFYDDHLPIAYCKSTFQEIWKQEEAVLMEASHHRFRTRDDINNWVFRYWHLAQGHFKPCGNRGFFMELDSLNAVQKAAQIIRQRKVPLLCLNDYNPHIEFETAKSIINSAFDVILPEKSSFER